MGYSIIRVEDSFCGLIQLGKAFMLVEIFMRGGGCYLETVPRVVRPVFHFSLSVSCVCLYSASVNPDGMIHERSTNARRGHSRTNPKQHAPPLAHSLCGVSFSFISVSDSVVVSTTLLQNNNDAGVPGPWQWHGKPQPGGKRRRVLPTGALHGRAPCWLFGERLCMCLLVLAYLRRGLRSDACLILFFWGILGVSPLV